MVVAEDADWDSASVAKGRGDEKCFIIERWQMRLIAEREWPLFTKRSNQRGLVNDEKGVQCLM